MDWIQFEFDYLLDLKRLTPHLLAIEAHKQAALTRVLPPQWRESSLEQALAEPTDEKLQLSIRSRPTRERGSMNASRQELHR